MLAPSQIPLDESLPQLAEVASEQVMRALFAAHFEPGWTLKRLRIKEARYHPGLACILTYQLRCQHIGGEEVRMRLHARAFVPGTAPDAFTKRPPLATRMGRLERVFDAESLKRLIDDGLVPSRPVEGAGAVKPDYTGSFAGTLYRDKSRELIRDILLACRYDRWGRK